MIPAERLYRLQQVDSRLQRLEAELAGLDDGSATRVEAEQARVSEQTARDDLHARQSRLKDMELELQSLVEKSAKVEQELYGGRVANPKELSALQDDLGSLKRHRGHLEDEMLVLMEEIETLMGTVHDLQALRETSDAALASRLQDLRQKNDTLLIELETLRARRDQQAREMDEDLLRKYERLRERKGGVAVSAVIAGVCDACHFEIPSGRVDKVKEGPELYNCDQCGRILYVKA